MKRTIFLLTLVFLFISPVIAQPIPQEDSMLPIKYQQNAQVFARFNTLQDFEPSVFAFSGVYNIWGRRFAASAGLFLQNGDTQLTLDGSYKFFKHDIISIATGVVYNLNWLHDISLTNNFLPYFNLEYKPVSFYTLDLNVDFLFKLRRLFVLSGSGHPLINASIAVSIKNTFTLPENFKIYIECASIEQFRYMIFCAPSFIFGAEYELDEKFDLCFELAVRYIDFFTLSAHYADSDIRLGARYKW
ncbi:MAG: hypothetical protein J5726_08290 [Treponema sp.]|nr:hypothetical protein [Treponema sp.]